MPSYTLGELLSYTTKRVGQRDDVSKSDVSFYINTSYEEIVDQAPHEFHEHVVRTSITSGEYRVTLPTDFASPIAVSLYTTAHGSAMTLEQVNVSNIDQGGNYPVGTPQRYALFRDWMELQPVPDSTTESQYSLQIRYESFATDLVNETDVPSVSTSWRKAIWYLAEAETWAHVQNPTQEAIARQRYTNYVRMLENRDAKRLKAQGGRGAHPVYQEVRPSSKRSFDVV